MSNSVTLEDIYQIFQRAQEETERRAAEFDRRLAESKAEADRRLAEWESNLAQSKAEADRRLAELEKLVTSANTAVNNLTSRWGRFVENLVEPAAVRLFQERGIDVKETHKRMKVKRGELEMEIDIFAVDDTEAVAIEVKSYLSQTEVDEFLENLTKFKQAFPAYKNYKIYGAVAGIEIDQGVDRYAYKKGLFVIRQSGETVEIANDYQFKPISW
jgi:hypothetical protein